MLDRLEIPGGQSDLTVDDCTITVNLEIAFDDTSGIYLLAEDVVKLRDWLNAWLQAREPSGAANIEGDKDRQKWKQLAERVGASTHVPEVRQLAAAMLALLYSTPDSANIAGGEAPDYVITTGSGQTLNALHKDRNSWVQDPEDVRAYRSEKQARASLEHYRQMLACPLAVMRYSELIRIWQEHGVIGEVD